MKIVSHLEHDADGLPHSTLCVVDGDQLVEQVEDNTAGRAHLFSKYDHEAMENGRWCGSNECCSSTGIHDGMTFGSGRLDNNGYWTKPCRVCAAAFDAKREERIKKLVDENGPPPEEDPRLYDWAEMDAWPYVDQDVVELGRIATEAVLEDDKQWIEFDAFFGIGEDGNV
jgi:hypothetical protein